MAFLPEAPSQKRKAMSLNLLLQETSQAVDYTVGIIVPGVVFVVSFLVAWLLYRHFSKEAAETSVSDERRSDPHLPMH
jgi:hypothetical protein